MLFPFFTKTISQESATLAKIVILLLSKLFQRSKFEVSLPMTAWYNSGKTLVNCGNHRAGEAGRGDQLSVTAKDDGGKSPTGGEERCDVLTEGRPIL